MVSVLLDAFYDECAEAIWERDGLLNKTMGDAVMAVFNFPIRRDDHAIQAVLAARAIQDRWSARRTACRQRRGADAAGWGSALEWTPARSASENSVERIMI